MEYTMDSKAIMITRHYMWRKPMLRLGCNGEMEKFFETVGDLTLGLSLKASIAMAHVVSAPFHSYLLATIAAFVRKYINWLMLYAKLSRRSVCLAGSRTMPEVSSSE